MRHVRVGGASKPQTTWTNQVPPRNRPTTSWIRPLETLTVSESRGVSNQEPFKILAPERLLAQTMHLDWVTVA